jgi:hypothetical protein
VGIAILYSIALIFIHKSSRKKENRLGLVLFMIFVPLIQILIISDIGLLLGLFAFGIPFYYSISIIAGIATLLFYRQIVKTHNLFFGIIISAVLLVFVPVISFELTNFELFSVLGGYHSGYWIIWQVMNGLAISIIGSIKSQKGIQKKLKTNL